MNIFHQTSWKSANPFLSLVPSPAFNVVPVFFGGDRWSTLKCANTGWTVSWGSSRGWSVGPDRGAVISGNQHLRCHCIDEWHDPIRRHWWFASADLMIQQKMKRSTPLFPLDLSLSNNELHITSWLRKESLSKTGVSKAFWAFGTS